ncbi:MAG: hypothetical protein PHD61_11270, partial [Bacteroidales bacterium]|nr:hypothetical protein [Bacteroidales bacterium]
MKNIFYLLGLIFLILSCNDKDEPKFIDQPADDVTYQVYLTDNQISGYKKYIKDEFAEKADYYDSDSLTQMIRTSAAGEIIEKVSYEMSDNNLALSATDSIFRPGLIYVATMDYEYQDGFMIKSNVHWKNIGDNTDSGIFTVTKTIENENIVSVNNSFTNWISGCTNYFEYGDQLNKLDIQSLTPGITGKISKNLIAQATWN